MKRLKRHHLGLWSFALSMLLSLLSLANSQQNGDAAAMLALRDALGNPSSLGWSGSDLCHWKYVGCSGNRVTRIQIKNLNLKGTLPSALKDLTELTVLEVMNNSLTGTLPSLRLSSLQTFNCHDNKFSFIPPEFFDDMTSLAEVYLDNNPFESWEIPLSLKNAASLKNFWASNANITGTIPDFFNVFPGLGQLHLSWNNLEGGLPASFSGSLIQSLWLNNQNSNGLNGTIAVLQNMTALTEALLQSNHFTGPLPDVTGISGLSKLDLRDNRLTGIVPASLANYPNPLSLILTNNLLQGPTPKFSSSVSVEMDSGSNRFCLSNAGVDCDFRVNVLLSIVKDFGYPASFADDWKGNDPCAGWRGISCSASGGNISIVDFQHMGLTGTISSNFSMLHSLQRLILSNNLLVGTIPAELTTLSNLAILDVSNNRLHGKIPNFRQNVQVNTDGNPNIGKDDLPPGTPPGSTPDTPAVAGGGNGGSHGSGSKKPATVMIAASVIGSVCVLSIIGLFVICYARKRRQFSKVQSPNTVVIHPRHSGDQHAVKITVTGSSTNSGAESHAGSSGASDIQVIEAGSMVISIQVLKNVTGNFSEDNVLGKGGFGTVYKGELHDGTKIAVKRMGSGVVSEKGLAEFKSEISVLTKVRHRHLVTLLGYCLDGNEKLLVYEYMPQGTLSKHLFNWKEEGLKPLEWTRRLTIALDVARGVEYLHGLAQQSFIHRDLKPSNILLGDDMRAKVADFGLVRLAPEGKFSIETRLAGTFGYLAPEYAVTGRVTTKVDVFSFGVILMEMITGRKALDESQPEDSLHLVTWFRRMLNNKDTFYKAIDPTINLDEEISASINKVSELAGHCTAREPYQRPDMGHVVNILSPLVELWKPTEVDSDEVYAIDFDITLPQALKKWKAFEGSFSNESSSFLASGDNTQTSIPPHPSGFAETFASTEGR